MATVNASFPTGNSRRSDGKPCTSGPSEGHVGFRMPSNNAQYTQEREKYLTAKYPKRQMGLIRKRIAVEHWVDEELRRLYGVSDTDTYDCEIDMDELLDLDEEQERRSAVEDKISNCNQSPDVIEKFITDLLEKANTL